jgi:hypothetical protein
VYNCYGRGICDTKTGLCKCDPPYIGTTCKEECVSKICKNFNRGDWKYCGDNGCGLKCDTCSEGEVCIGDYCTRTCNPKCVNGECKDGVCMYMRRWLFWKRLF